MPSTALDVAVQPVIYRESDGEPMGETEDHIDTLIYLREVLKEHFRAATDVYVNGDMLFYYEEGNPVARVAPDVFVVKGVATHKRRIYKLWEERVPPAVVFEITSRGTRLEDQGTKRALYEMLGVREYFLVDPLSEYLRPPLQGYRLQGDDYRRVATLGDGSLHSEELGLILVMTAAGPRLRDPATGEDLPPPLERAARESERAARESERASRESERASRESERASRESERADRETQRADRESAARRVAEEKVARLEADLDRLHKG